MFDLPFRERPALRVAAAFAVLLLATSASGQGIGGIVDSLRGTSGVGAVVEPQAEERAIAMARDSLEQTAKREADEILASREAASSDRAARVEALVSDAVERFVREVRNELVDAKGDGLLTRSELSEEIQEARDFVLEDLRGALQAAIDGASRPPVYEDSDNLGAYAVAITRYIVVERNAPRVWGILAAWIIGAILLVFAVSRISQHLGENASVLEWIPGPLAVAREPLLLIAFAVGLSAGRRWIWLPVFIEDAVAVLVELLILAGVFWVWWRVSGRFARAIAQMFSAPGSQRSEATDVTRKALRLLGLGVFSLVVAESVFDTDVTALLAGVGVLGIAVSVGAQDTLRNLAASMTIHGDRPFVPGDLVRFRGTLGKIEEVGFRSTRIRELDGPVVVVPNAALVRESIANLSARTHIRHHYAIDLEFGTPPDRVREAVSILEEILEARDHPEDAAPHVVFDSYGAYNLRIELWYTSDTGDYFESKKDRGEVNLEILSRFGEAGIDFAFPTQTLHLAGDHEGEGSEASHERSRSDEDEDEDEDRK